MSPGYSGESQESFYIFSNLWVSSPEPIELKKALGLSFLSMVPWHGCYVLHELAATVGNLVEMKNHGPLGPVLIRL